METTRFLSLMVDTISIIIILFLILAWIKRARTRKNGGREIVKEWVTKTGLKARVVKWRKGLYFGYVAVQKGHRLFGVQYDCDTCTDIDVHGGLTLSHRIGEDWWFGFDCIHDFDLFDRKDEKFVTTECEKLANQLSSPEFYCQRLITHQSREEE